LEDDLRQLQAADALPGHHAAQPPVGSHVSNATIRDNVEMPGWKKACLLYRVGQKQLVRDYLKAARQELQDTLVELQALMEVTGTFIDD
jgi:hypothetical protein